MEQAIEALIVVVIAAVVFFGGAFADHIDFDSEYSQFEKTEMTPKD